MGDRSGRNGHHHGADDDGATRSLCPICGHELPGDGEAFPFCSERCRNIDLGKWLGEQYTISRPIEEADLDEDD